MNTKTLLVLILAIVSLLSCKNEPEQSISGNWARISDDVYYEFYFGDSIVESFNRTFKLQHVSSYELINDSILIDDERFSIEVINDSILIISDSVNSIEFQKIFDKRDEFLLSDLIKTGVYKKEFDDEEFQRILRRFLDSNFTIREAEYRIANGHLNKDTLLALWESKASADSSENSYWKYLIKRIKN